MPPLSPAMRPHIAEQVGADRSDVLAVRRPATPCISRSFSSRLSAGRIPQQSPDRHRLSVVSPSALGRVTIARHRLSRRRPSNLRINMTASCRRSPSNRSAKLRRQRRLESARSSRARLPRDSSGAIARFQPRGIRVPDAHRRADLVVPAGPHSCDFAGSRLPCVRHVGFDVAAMDRPCRRDVSSPRIAGCVRSQLQRLLITLSERGFPWPLGAGPTMPPVSMFSLRLATRREHDPL